MLRRMEKRQAEKVMAFLSSSEEDAMSKILSSELPRVKKPQKRKKPAAAEKKRGSAGGKAAKEEGILQAQKD